METTPPSMHSFENRDQLFAELRTRITSRLTEGITLRGEATLVVSGGSSPVPLFEALATADLPWEKVTITLADERWVPPHHQDANERLVREKLLQGHAAGAHFVGLKTSHNTPEEGQEACRARLAEITRPFDVVLLGMGNDGHTASLFPGGDNLEKAVQTTGPLCYAMNAPGAAQPRMTLSLAALLDCRDLVLLCTGADKRETFAEALNGQGPSSAMPIRYVLQQSAIAPAFYHAP